MLVRFKNIFQILFAPFKIVGGSAYADLRRLELTFLQLRGQERRIYDFGRDERKSHSDDDEALPLKPGRSCGRAREVRKGR